MKTVLDFHKMKEQGRKISMITCYDYSSARAVAASNVDCVLVGDSVAMTMHGYDSTLAADPKLIALHVRAVRQGAPKKFIVGDMPFLAHRGSLDRTMDAVAEIMRAGAQAVKIEGVDGSEETIRHIVESGVPVMGHLGLTPQSVHQLGGYKVQGTAPDAAEVLMSQARRLEECGVFALVLECIPTDLAKKVTEHLAIPTIGIGAGNVCSGQVLVIQDMLGLNVDFQPKFVRRYAEAFSLMKEAFDHFDRDVKSGEFPSKEESY
jgi:3-methyl-2-oxobutanoate hydroxymethyltransferase